MLREITDKTEWDKMISASAVRSGRFLQSWQWGEFQKALGRKIFRFADDGLAALVVELPLPFGKKYWLCPKGPVMNVECRMSNVEFIDELKNVAKKAGAVFLRIEPEIATSPSAPRDDENTGVIASEAKQSHDINPRATSIVDLSKTEDELLAAMHPKTRYNIRVAEKHKVAINRYADAASVFDELMKLFAETSRRDKFNLHPLEYYRKQMEAFDEKRTFTPGVKSPHLVVFTAGVEQKMLAAAIVMFDGEDVTYLHGASSNQMRNVMAPYALHWAVIKRAKERGYKHYDFWGVSDDAKSSWAGITRFKRGFGGADVSTSGTWDLPLNNFWYSVYTLARRMRP
jgi:peptidoglycan pentaglycine glycine transferase (the first glycine)